MEIPSDLVTLAVGGGVTLLFTNTLKIVSIGRTLKDHIATEEVNDRKTRIALHRIRKKLPNGEVEKTFNMVRELHGYFEDEIREWKLGEEGKTVMAEHARMDAKHDRENQK